MAAQIICELPGDGCPECDRHEEHWLWAGAFANERSGMTLAELRDVARWREWQRRMSRRKAAGNG